MSVQTTPSLKKLSQTTPVGKVPAQPTFTSPPKVEETTKKEAEVPAKKEERVKSDLSSIASIGDKKLDGKLNFYILFFELSIMLVTVLYFCVYSKISAQFPPII